MSRPRPLSIEALRVRQRNAGSPGAIVDIARQEIEAQDGRLHAVRHLYDEPDTGASDGPLAGIPYLTKANIAVAGRPLDCASRILEGYVSPYDATVTERLRAAGAWLLGATNMDEFGMGSSTEHSCGGPTRNPLDLDRTPGGSSGGSAAAVAAGWVPFALGSDTGGSVRQPAAFCGLVGLRPTYGRVSRHGLVAFASSLDQIGPLARRVDDVAEVFWILAGVDPCDMTTVEPAREFEDELPERPCLGVPQSLVAMATTPVRDHFARCHKRLTEAGFELVDVELPASRRATEIYTVLAAAEASSNLARFDGLLYGRRVEAGTWERTVRRSRTEGFGLEVQRRILGGVFALAAEQRAHFHDRAQGARRRVREEHRRALEGCDALLLPTAPTLPFRLGENLDDPVHMYGSDVFTTPASLAGLPALALPSGATERGLPHSLQLVGPPFGERRLFELGRRLEELFEVERLQREILRPGGSEGRS